MEISININLDRFTRQCNGKTMINDRQLIRGLGMKELVIIGFFDREKLEI